MAQKKRKKGSGPGRARTRAKPVRRRSASASSRTRRARAALEEVRRGPLEPELPIDAAASPEAVDPDALEILHDTQELAPERPTEGLVEPAADRQRGTVLSGGDVDAAWDETDVGEETVGGSTPTPDQDVVDELGRAAGVTYSDTEPLRPEEKEAQRDEKRWEVDPASAEDYPERVREMRRPRKRRR